MVSTAAGALNFNAPGFPLSLLILGFHVHAFSNEARSSFGSAPVSLTAWGGFRFWLSCFLLFNNVHITTIDPNEMAFLECPGVFVSSRNSNESHKALYNNRMPRMFLGSRNRGQNYSFCCCWGAIKGLNGFCGSLWDCDSRSMFNAEFKNVKLKLCDFLPEERIMGL